MGEFGRRNRARKGSRVAIKAVARKLAEQYWSLMVKGKEFVEYGVNKYQERLLQQKRKYLQRLTLELAKTGFSTHSFTLQDVKKYCVGFSGCSSPVIPQFAYSLFIFWLVWPFTELG